MKKPIYTVALGASAGGHQALWEFFAHMPGQLPIAFVVIQHLKADAVSIADKLLAKHTSLPVHWASDEQALQAGHIYLLPPGQYMRLQTGKLQLTERTPVDKINRAIDIFLSSLAQDWDGYSLGIILSGAGSDGALGALQLHAHGGIVMVQDPQSADFSSMPKWAIRQDHVQLALAPKQLAKALTQLIKQANQKPLKLAEQLLSQKRDY